MSSPEFRIRIIQSVADVSAAAWNRCASESTPIGEQGEVKLTSEDNRSPKLSTQGQANNPFVTHEFLSSLEESKSVGRRTGWEPRHLLAEDQQGALVGAAPCYVKSHSRGEYVFDHGWADAFERAGGQYYPKLQVAVPFTPVPGPRLLTRGHDADVREALIGALRSVAEQSQLSSLHVTFCTADEAAAMGEAGFLHRVGVQYHFDNPGYGSFDDFLGALASRKRKSIRKEREQVKEYGLTIRALSGAEITQRHWDAFF